ncbi:MAG: glycoside hydrolase family 30 beta sandwich domain-containing protein [Treponema sp.]
MTPATIDGKMGNTMESTSFIRPDGKIVLVVMNRTEDDMVFELNCAEKNSKDKNEKMDYTVKVNSENSNRTFFCPPRSIQTYLLENS